MLRRQATSRWALSKYMLVLPAMLGLLAMTTVQDGQKPGFGELSALLTVKGQVTNDSGIPLPGTSVMDGRRLMQTDKDGRFEFTELQNPATIMFSHIGFESAIVNITQSREVTIKLKTAQEELPPMGATEAYKAIKSNANMPVHDLPSTQSADDQGMQRVNQNPVFPGGIPALMQYVTQSLSYPEKARNNKTQGDVLVAFTITAEGNVADVLIRRGIGDGCDEEAVRIVKQMPKWQPGMQHGHSTAVSYVLPIRFSVD